MKNIVLPILITLLVSGLGSYVILTNVASGRPTNAEVDIKIASEGIKTQAWVLERERVYTEIFGRITDRLVSLDERQKKLELDIEKAKAFEAGTQVRIEEITRRLDALK